jgi:PTS system galactitol-specific IIA component
MAFQLARFLEPNSICLQVDLKDRDEVITLLGRRLEARGLVKDTFVGAAIAREREMPTGLPLAEGMNVAVPHTDPEHVIKTGLALATLAHPAYFGSMDDPENMLPVRVVIVMALSERKAQIEMLQSIADLFQNQEILEALVAAKTPEEVLATLGRTGAGSNGSAPLA